jgi:hypothetical protein
MQQSGGQPDLARQLKTTRDGGLRIGNLDLEFAETATGPLPRAAERQISISPAASAPVNA